MLVGIVAAFFFVLILFWISGFPEGQRISLEGYSAPPSEAVIGELVDGLVVDQALVLPHVVKDEGVSIGVKLATYQRRNAGIVELSLLQEGRIVSRRFESRGLKDNSWVFLDIPSHQFEPGNAILRLKGEGGMRNTSPTVWSHTIREGEVAYVRQGVKMEKTLCYYFASTELYRRVFLKDLFYSYRPFFWTGLGLLIVFALVVGARWLYGEVGMGAEWDVGRAWILVVLALFFLKSGILSWNMIPRWDLPDEYGHYSYIEDLSEGRGLPVLGKSELSNWVKQDIGKEGDFCGNWIAQHPPLYYVLMAPVHRALSWCIGDPLIVFKCLRIVSSFFGISLLWMIYLLARQLGLSRFMGTALTAGVGMIPMVTNLTAGLGHDLLLSFLCCWGCLHWIRFSQNRKLREFWLACLVFGLACVTKYTALVISMVWFAGVAVSYRESMRVWLKGVTTGFVILFAPISLWMVRNLVVYDRMLPVSDDGIIGNRVLDFGFFEFLRHFDVLSNLFHNGISLLGWMAGGQDGKGLLLFLPPQLWAPYGLVLVGLACLSLGVFRSLYGMRGGRKLNDFALLTCMFPGVVASIFVFRTSEWLFQLSLILLSCCVLWMLWINLRTNLVKAEGFLAVISISHCVILGFCGVLLYKMYQFALAVGFLKAAHGRYLYPLVGFFIIGFCGPVLKGFEYRRKTALGVLVFLQVLEAMVWLYYAPGFFLR